MKKLMIAAAASALVGGAFAIESANIVGYQERPMTKGDNTFIVQTLMPIGKDRDSTDIQDFKVKDGADGWMVTSDKLATLKPNGNLLHEYGYCSAYWAEMEGDPAYQGWWDFEVCQQELFEEVGDDRRHDDLKIPFGTAILVYTSKANNVITFAGEVEDGVYEIPMTKGDNTFVGNVSPATITLQDIEPKGGANGWMVTSDKLATLKPNGNLLHEYGYCSAYWAEMEGDAAYEGWWDFEVCQQELFEEVGEDRRHGTDVTFNPGDGFLVYTSKANMTLPIPSAIKD